MYRKNLLKLLVLASLVTGNSALAADITIIGTENTSQFFTEDNQQLIIGNGGSLEPAISTTPAISVNGGPHTGLQININSGNADKGIIVADNNDFSAIEISDGSSISAITLTSGLISNGSDTAATISLTGGGGEVTIATASGSVIRNNHGEGTAINSDTTNDTNLTITNAGTIRAGDGSESYTVSNSAINFNDADGGSTLTINNTGSINASALDENASEGDLNGKFRNAILVGSSDNTITINNSGTGTIAGDIVVNENNATITNSSTSDNAIGGNISATTGKLTMVMSAGTMGGNQSATGNINLGSHAESSLTVSGTGLILGRVDMGNVTQEINFDGGIIAGDIFGSDGNGGFAGDVLINETTVLNGSLHNVSNVTIADNQSLNIAFNANNINAENINIGAGATFIVGTDLQDGQGDPNNAITVTGAIYASTAGTSNFEVAANLRFTSAGNIGGVTVGEVTHSFDEVKINDGSSLNLVTNNNAIFANNVVISGSGVLEVGSGHINSNIISDTSTYNGIVAFSDDTTVTGVVGSAGLGLDTVEISAGKTVSIGDDDTVDAYSMAVKTLVLGGEVTLNLGQTAGEGTIISNNGFSFIDGSVGNNTINGNIKTTTSDSTITLTDGDIINGNISITSGKLLLGTDNSTIVGNIDLGSHADSAVTFNGSSYQGDITMNNEAQEVTLSTASSSLVGIEVDTAGSINGAGNFIIEFTPDTFNFNIGNTTALTSVQLGTNVTLNAATHNNALRAAEISLNSGAQLTLGTGTTSGNIIGVNEGYGNVTYSATTAKDYNIGTANDFSNKVNRVTISNSAALTNQGNIMASTIIVGDDSSITSTSGVIGSSGGTISLNAADASLTVRGTSSVAGYVMGNNSNFGRYIVGSTYTNNFDIGSDEVLIDELNRFEIEAAGNLSTNANIYATNTEIAGTLNLTGNGQSIGAVAAPTTIAVLDGGTLNIDNGLVTINGSLSIANNATLAVTIDSATTSGQILLSGLATIADNAVLKITFDPSIEVAGGTTFEIISGSEPISAITDIVVNDGSNIFDGLRYSTRVSGNNLLIVAANLEVSVNVNSRESQAMLGFVNNMIGANNASGKLLEFQEYLLNDATTNEQADAALESATPQSNNSLHRSVFAALTNSISAIDDRLAASFGNSSGISSGDENLSNEAWVQTFGSTAKQDKLGGIEGYKLNSSGMAFGYDKAVEDLGDARVGVAASFMNSNIKSESGTKKTNVASYQINAYSSHKFGNYFLENIVGFALNDYRTNRAIASVNVNSDSEYFGKSFIAKIKAGEHFYFAENFDFIPQVSLNYIHNQINGHNENSAGNMSLHIKNTSSNFLEGRVGFDLAHKNLFGETQFIQTLRASYGYDFIGDRQITTSNFVDQSVAFSSQISKVNRESLRLGVGFDIFQTDAISFKLDYGYERKREYDSHSGVLKAKYGF